MCRYPQVLGVRGRGADPADERLRLGRSLAGLHLVRHRVCREVRPQGPHWLAGGAGQRDWPALHCQQHRGTQHQGETWNSASEKLNLSCEEPVHPGSNKCLFIWFLKSLLAATLMRLANFDFPDDESLNEIVCKRKVENTRLAQYKPFVKELQIMTKDVKFWFMGKR